MLTGPLKEVLLTREKGRTEPVNALTLLASEGFRGGDGLLVHGQVLVIVNLSDSRGWDVTG